MKIKRTGLLALGLAVAAVHLGGCASVAKEVVRQVMEKQADEDEDKHGDKDRGDDSRKERSDRGEDNRDSEEEDWDSEEEGWDSEEEDWDSEGGGSNHNGNAQNRENGAKSSDGLFHGSFDQFIQNELEPRLGTMKDGQFSYNFMRSDSQNTEGFIARPAMASLDSGIVSTFLRDLNKDGRDELLVAYVEGSKQSSDGKNHFLLGIYGDTGSGISEWGRIGFDDCFSGHNGEEYLFGLKDLGDRRLLYAGGSSHVWTWADGSDPQIHLYQMEGGQLKEIYQVSTGGSDNSWMPQWRRELQSFGFDLPNSDWSETNLAGESGFEVLAYGECYTKDLANGSSYGSQQYWLENGLVVGGIYGSDSQMVMQMNLAMQPYSGGNSGVSSGAQSGSYASGTQSGSYSSSTQGSMNSSGGQGGFSGQAQSYGTGDYIFPNSSTTYLTRADLAGLSQEQLRLARNEIYARHGRKFKTKELQDYFNSKSWYTGTIESNAFKDDYLNAYEKENIKLIQSLEN